jgi:hypothetical protein
LPDEQLFPDLSLDAAAAPISPSRTSYWSSAKERWRPGFGLDDLEYIQRTRKRA